MKKLVLVVYMVLLVSFAFGQARSQLLSPYHSLSYFLTNMSDDNYYPDSAGRVFYPSYLEKDKAATLSIKLKQIVDGKGLYIDMEKIPNDPDWEDSLTYKAHYQIHNNYPDIYLEKIDGKWYFSKTTTERIPVLHKEVFPFGTDKLLNLLPAIGNDKILGIKIWQYLGILVIVFICFVIHKLLSSVLVGVS